MRNTLFALVLILALLSGCQTNKASENIFILSEKIPSETAIVFSPGIISTEESHESAIAFNKGMTELYLNRRKPNKPYKIYISKYMDGKWTEPKLAPFYSGKDETFSDYRPRLSPDGDILYFISDRPLPGQTKSTGMHQWYAKKDKDKWSNPLLFEELASSEPILDVVAANSGNLYFSSNKKGGNTETEGVYYSIYNNGIYAEAKRFQDNINSPNKWTCCPFIAPDESYMIFDSPRKSGYGWADLYISFNENGVWSKSYNLGPTVNTELGEGLATVTPDGKYLFFYKDNMGKGDIYWVDFEILKNRILDSVSN